MKTITLTDEQAFKIEVALYNCGNIIDHLKPEQDTPWYKAIVFSTDEALNIIRSAKRIKKETPFDIGRRLATENMGISSIWGAIEKDSDLEEAHRGFMSVNPGG
jgi:hypothetical protein